MKTPMPTPKPPMDDFSTLVAAHYADAKKADPAASYEDSIQFVSRTWPAIYEKHVRQIGGDAGL